MHQFIALLEVARVVQVEFDSGFVFLFEDIIAVEAEKGEEGLGALDGLAGSLGWVDAKILLTILLGILLLLGFAAEEEELLFLSELLSVHHLVDAGSSALQCCVLLTLIA